MYFLDSVFAKIDYFMLVKHNINPESYSSAFIQAFGHSGCDGYFAYNIHARNHFDLYIKKIKGFKVAHNNGLHELSDIDRDFLYWNDRGDIKKDSEPMIPDPNANITNYDDLSYDTRKSF